MADGVLHCNLIHHSAVIQGDLDGVSDGTLLWVMVHEGIGLVFNAGHLLAQGIDARVRSDQVVVVSSGEAAEDEGNRNHVLDAVVTVGIVVQRSLLVDDTDGGFLGADAD